MFNIELLMIDNWVLSAEDQSIENQIVSIGSIEQCGFSWWRGNWIRLLSKIKQERDDSGDGTFPNFLPIKQLDT